MKNLSAFFSARIVRSSLTLSLLLCGAGSAAAFNAEDGFGVGFVLGSPSGLSLSLPMGEKNAINAIAGYSLYQDANFQLQADYVWIENEILPVESGKVGFYYGPGAFAVLSNETAAGIHAVAGVDYHLQEVPLQIFLQIAPGINVLPNTKIAMSGGLGLRYYF